MPTQTYRDLSSDGPHPSGVAITPSDLAGLARPTRGIYVGGTGDLRVILADDADDSTPLTFKAVPVGTLLRINVKKVMSTGTTATLLIALF
jgi:hypothetical protein